MKDLKFSHPQLLTITHLRVDHRANEFLRGKSHINGIESFWGYAKTRLSKFRGIDKKMFNLHLK